MITMDEALSKERDLVERLKKHTQQLIEYNQRLDRESKAILQRIENKRKELERIKEELKQKEAEIDEKFVMNARLERRISVLVEKNKLQGVL